MKQHGVIDLKDCLGVTVLLHLFPGALLEKTFLSFISEDLESYHLCNDDCCRETYTCTGTIEKYAIIYCYHIISIMELMLNLMLKFKSLLNVQLSLKGS